jgi:hypothetical protein
LNRMPVRLRQQRGSMPPMILEGVDVGGVSNHLIDVELDEHRGRFHPHGLRARVRASAQTPRQAQGPGRAAP